MMNNFWLRIVEVFTFSIIVIAVLYSVIGIPYTVLPTILFFTYLLLGIVEYCSTTPLIHIFLPISIFSVGLLGSHAFYGIVKHPSYNSIVLLYMISIFFLYLALYLMAKLILGERNKRFVREHAIVIKLMEIYIFMTTVLIIWLTIERTIRVLASIIFLVTIPAMWVITRKYIGGKVIELTIPRYTIGRKEVFKHPQEPEVEKVILTLTILLTMPIFLIPLLFMYTKVLLIQRTLIPLALLGVYEGIACVLYTVYCTLATHGAYIEELFKKNEDEIINVEHYTVLNIWEDVSWFINRSAGYYYRGKYLTALYMLLQGLEVLAKKHDYKDLYYANMYTVLKEGYNYLRKRGLLKLTQHNALIKTINYFKNENTWVVEASTKAVDKESRELKEIFKSLFIDLINFYLKLKEEPEKALKEKNEVLETTIIKLKNFIKSRNLASDTKKHVIEIIDKLSTLIRESKIKQSDLEFILEKKPLTINMLRNYLVHGQLVKNAIVYKGSREQFDEIASNPLVLYSIYTLSIAYVYNKLKEKGYV